MAHCYPQPTFGIHAHSGWEDDGKSTFDDNASHLNGDRSYSDSMPDAMAESAESRRQSVVKLEEEFAAAQIWHGRPHSPAHPMRHYSVPNIDSGPERMARMMSQPYGTPYGPPHTWMMNHESGSSTPTVMYGPVVDSLPLSFNATTGMYPFQHDVGRSIAMSPQSSQGGWASANSDGSVKKCEDDESPTARPVPGMSVQRNNRNRKPNARFDIPSNVTLDNVEELIKNETDENVKKELKQQKRLLRNRLAALDSRSRKRLEMDSLRDQRKKWLEEQKELVDEIAQLKHALECEQKQMMQDRQQYEAYMQGVAYERDEAIRSRTLETAELRRQNNILKEMVRDFERQQTGRGFSQTPAGINGYENEFTSIGNLDLGDDAWEHDFLINSDLTMDGDDSPRTPRPLPVDQHAVTTAVSNASSKTDQGFSWNTFYMCLLFGAFIASQPNKTPQDPGASMTAEQNTSLALPFLSDEYRAEANNVLKAVLAAEDGDAAAPAPSMSAFATTGNEQHLPLMLPQTQPPSSLELLSTHLTTPTRQQQIAAAFALTPAQYEHITNPEGLPLSHVPSHTEHGRLTSSMQSHQPISKPSPLQTMIASMQAERDEMERAMGLGSKARERSAIPVTEKMLQDLRRLVAEREAMAEKQQH